MNVIHEQDNAWPAVATSGPRSQKIPGGPTRKLRPNGGSVAEIQGRSEED